MKVKNSFWALAFALMAVSCSDDIEGGPNGNNGQEMNGTKTFMQVSINTGVVTRATGGEEGDSNADKGETGEANEYEVDDVTVVLFKNGTGNDAPTAFNYDSKLVAAGYVQTSKTSTGDENWHNRVATVEIDITDASEDFDGKTYGIIAVTNLGDAAKLKNRIKSDDINTGAELANLLQESAWNGASGSETKFIMSTHNDQYGSSTKIFDCVTLHANATSENAPRADVHVERLAAKVRIGAHNNAAGFIYNVEEGTSNVIAKVRLDQVQLVNKQNRGTYLLKRVSNNVTDETTKTIPAKEANGDNYLSNEVWNSATGQTAFNYVIDPWSRSKVKLTADNKSGIESINGQDITTTSNQTTTLSYENDYTGTNFTALWTAISNDAISLANNTTDFTDSKKKTISYTLENTVSAEASQAGYMTGALFKATYFPKEYMAVTQEGGKNVVKPVDVDYNGESTTGTGFDDISATTSANNINFYVFNGNVYKNYEAIFNEYVWNEQKSVTTPGTKVYGFSDFNTTNVTSIKITDLMNSTLMNGAANDPFGYLQALKTKYKDNKDNSATLATADAFETVVNATTGTEDIKKKLAAITFYENCVCYYPYWIKHADNNKTTDMGVMEFGIVRNNIYDLAVSKITKLGLSGMEVPDPTEPGESKELRFIVDINVKNWVVRNNGGIIL